MPSTIKSAVTAQGVKLRSKKFLALLLAAAAMHALFQRLEAEKDFDVQDCKKAILAFSQLASAEAGRLLNVAGSNPGDSERLPEKEDSGLGEWARGVVWHPEIKAAGKSSSNSMKRVVKRFTGKILKQRKVVIEQAAH